MAIPTDNAVALTGDPLIDGLVQGSAWRFFGASHNLTYSLSLNDNALGGAWSTALGDALRRALGVWSNVADLTFTEVSSGVVYTESTADIAVILTGNELSTEAMGTVLGLGIFPSPSFADTLLTVAGATRAEVARPEGDVALENYNGIFGYLYDGGGGFSVMLHELGHALGLKHPFDAGGNGRPTFGQLGIAGYDSALYTAMSYSDTAGTVYQNGASGNFATPMLLDILAIQRIYGANTTYHAGDDAYELAPEGQAAASIRTIWDAGGSDTLSAGGGAGSAGVTIDLRAGQFSSAAGNQVAIAYNVAIENATGGAGNDSLSGNSDYNLLIGREGNDTLIGGDGDDTLLGEISLTNLTSSGAVGIIGYGIADVLEGGAGNDTLDGGIGDDVMRGGLGNDTYIVGSAADVVAESSAEGSDGVFATTSFSLPDNVENLTLVGSSNLSATGNGLDNALTGNDGRNWLIGGAGRDTLAGGYENDRLDGGADADNLQGGAGDDVFLLAAIADFASGEVIDGGDGSNELHYIGDGAGTLMLTRSVSHIGRIMIVSADGDASGTAAISVNAAVAGGYPDIFGNDGGNALTGNRQANSLYGRAGDDTLIGGAGDDYLVGGTDADVFRYLVKTDSTTAAQDRIADFGPGDTIDFAGMSGISLYGSNYAYGASVAATVDAIRGDATVSDAIVCFSDGSNEYVCVKGAGSGISFDGTLIGIDGSVQPLVGACFQFSPSPGKTIGTQAYAWKSHALLGGVDLDAGHITGADGSATFVGITGATLDVAPTRIVPSDEATATSQAVNLQDAIAILKMIVGLDVNGANNPLSPYQAIAADFDGSGGVNLTDAIGVLKHVVGLTAPAPAWLFVDEADTTMAARADLNPGVVASALSADVTTATNLGLVGILRGDVDGSWAAPAGSPTLEDAYFQTLSNDLGIAATQWGIYPA